MAGVVGIGWGTMTFGIRYQQVRFFTLFRTVVGVQDTLTLWSFEIYSLYVAAQARVLEIKMLFLRPKTLLVEWWFYRMTVLK